MVISPFCTQDFDIVTLLHALVCVCLEQTIFDFVMVTVTIFAVVMTLIPV